MNAWRWRAWPLRAKIGVLVVAGAALPLLVAQGLAMQRARAVAEEHWASLLITRTEQLAGEIDAINQFYLAAAQRTARLPGALRVLTQPRATDIADLRQALAAWPDTDDDVFATEIVDSRGRIVAASAERFVDFDIAFRAFFRRALHGGPTISDPFVSVPLGGNVPLVAFAAPVYADGTTTIGVAVVLVRAAALWRAVRAGNERIGHGSYALLCDAWGIRLAHSLRDDLMFRPTGPIPPDAVEALVRERRFGESTRVLLEAPISSVEIIEAAVEAVSRGDSPRLPVKGTDELARLAARFNEMAAAVRGARENLEVRVRQRTEELTRVNAELEAQKQELLAQRQELEHQRRELMDKNTEIERADRLKSEFLANMSHELRTPLNSIIGFSELLAEQAGAKLSEGEVRYLTDVQVSGRHLLQLINDILDLSKIEAGRVVLDLAAVDPAAAIADATALVLPAARKKGLDLRAETAETPLVRADPSKLRQVLLNLLANAIKFAPEGSSVEVGARASDDAVRFFVRDHGPGVEEALRRRIFQPFVQGESPLVKKHQGTGLGLAIRRRLVELQGGEIDVESTPGQGATFWFTLPEDGEHLAPGEEARRAVVFLVEENPSAARLLQEWLEAEGHRVVQVGSGTDAWDLAARMRPDAIVLDPAAANLDGFELLDQLKRRKATRNIPVVVSTAPMATDFLVKPPEREQLLGVVADGAGPGGGSPPPVVLAIDDEPLVITILRAVLEPAGYRVVSAAGGKEGLELAFAQRPDAIIVDLVMPEVSGFAVVDALARDERTRSVPVIVLTAAELTEAQRAHLGSSVRAISEKGAATREELVTALRRALARAAPVPAGATVVVIDDNDLNRELARALLERRGWRVLLAESGAAGLALVRSERPALVICDLAMPGKDGLAVARELRGDPATAAIPLVALTALAMRGDEQRAYAAGFDAYLAKPIDRKRLDETLARVLTSPRTPPGEYSI